MESLLKDNATTSTRIADVLSQLRRFNSELSTYRETLFFTSVAFLVLGTVENIIVCLVFCKASTVRTAAQSNTKLSHFFILQLSITDLVFRAVSFFRRLSAKFLELSPEYCKTVIFSQFTCAAVTFVLLSGIAVDRYIHILFPLRSLRIKTRKCLIMLSIWVYALLICSGFIPSATVSDELFKFRNKKRQLFLVYLNSTKSNASRWDFREPRQHCIPGSLGSLERRQIAFTVYFLFAFVVPLLCIIFSYSKITVFLWRKTKENNTINRNIAKAKLRAVQMFALVVASFLISWGPIMILDMFNSYPLKTGKQKVRISKFHLRPLFDCISQTSSIFNPIIYAFGDSNFRRNLRLLFCGRKKRSFEVNRVSPARIHDNYIQITTLNTRKQGFHKNVVF